MLKPALTAVDTAANAITSLATKHACYRHPLFEKLRHCHLQQTQVAALLKNYDAHACVLRRLLLKAASMMPEPAVGFVLENVRNEYGNGNYCGNHQNQLRDVAAQCGVFESQMQAAKVTWGVKRFIKEASTYYGGGKNADFYRPAVAAGAITATEILAIEEFRALQCAFTRLGQRHHIWFHHVTIEEEHTDESLALALYFAETQKGKAAVKFGMSGVLNANLFLYDGLLEAIS